MHELSNLELKTVGLSILESIDKICRSNNIKYFIGFGTLLGAIRHKGFIPWDDDVDICMLREDYKRFISVMKDEANYRLICFETDPNYYFSFARVCDKHTFIRNRPHRIINKFGVWVDVFPIDNAPEAKERDIWLDEYDKRKTRMLLTIPTPYERFSFSRLCHYNTIKNIFLRKSLGVRNFHRYRDEFNKWIMQYNCNETSDVFIASTPYKMKACFPRTIFEKAIDVAFENLQVCAPIGYDYYLTALYGDYMKLPPIEDRNTKHFFKAYRIDEKQ